MKFNSETPTKPLTIQGQIFRIPEPFSEGHVCSVSEAGALNQTLAENIRNNQAAEIKKMVEDTENPFDLTVAQAKIDSYIEEYDFGVRRGRGPVDPVEREALVIALDAVKQAIRNKGYKMSDIAKEDIDRHVENALENNPQIMKEAKRRVDQRKSIVDKGIDISDLGGTTEAAVEAEVEAAA